MGHKCAPRGDKYTAAFPEELVERLVRFYSYVSETVLDPFLGTGTTCAVAKRLGRNCVGYEIDLELRGVEERLGVGVKMLYTDSEDRIEVAVGEDAKKLENKAQRNREEAGEQKQQVTT